MLKNLLRIPDTFDPDDRRRRQVLNVLLIILIVFAIPTILVAFFTTSAYNAVDAKLSQILIFLIILSIIFFFGLLWMNRSSRIPAWLTGGISIGFVLFLCSQSDSPAALYNGRSTLVWVLPILLGALIFPSKYHFFIMLIIFTIMQFLNPNEIRSPSNHINYYSTLMLLFITLISWFGQRISNQAILDARTQAETANRHAANLEAILNSIADGVLVRDMQGNLLVANPALLQMIPQEQLTELITKPLENKTRWQRKLFTITTATVPAVGSVAIFRDETRRYETERAKDALLATASHELRTPLTAVMNYLEIIQSFMTMGKINTDQFKNYVERAIENTNRLHQLINNILDQAQIQAGELELKESNFKLSTLLERTHHQVEGLLKQKGLSYVLNIASNVPIEIRADPDRLHQVLVNLIGNAIKFTQQGMVDVKVFVQNPDQLVIEVVDSGVGIAQERLPDIFEPFRRGSDYAQREQQGAGLGLSITKEIINRMGGEISVASKLGKGSTFKVLLPLQTG